MARGGVTLWSQEVKNNVKAPTWQEPARQNTGARKNNILDNLTQGQDTHQESENPDEDTPPPPLGGRRCRTTQR